MIATVLLAGLAGFLSLLSPCVLPLLPILIASSVAAHRLGPAALAIGLALSFTMMGLMAAIAGRSLEVDTETVRLGSAIMMIAAGFVLAAPPLQRLVTAVLTPWAAVFSSQAARPASGIAGQFSIGLLLGMVWSPCVGPTLGAATVLASRGENLASVALTMFAFGLGAGLPLVMPSAVPNERFMAARSAMRWSGHFGTLALGAAMSVAGLLVLTGADRTIEALLLPMLPEWLVGLTTRF